MPERIQLHRTKGWRKPEGAIVVSRPSRWGNPFRIGSPSGLARVPAVNYPERDWEYEGRCTAAGAYHPYVSNDVAAHPKAIATPELSIKAYVPCHVRHMTPTESVECYRAYVTGGGWPIDWTPRPGFTIDDIRAELAGRDLACWCPLGQPCHADVLLEIANSTTESEVSA
ncbi:DUF4326 domain-containing protein [Mycobacteroides chelonae]|uniref:DUF4326 domain-containing protein n=1 Tax=Mycobacteroides chelonae TaxID=1774 RepID=UPI003571FCC2